MKITTAILNMYLDLSWKFSQENILYIRSNKITQIKWMYFNSSQNVILIKKRQLFCHPLESQQEAKHLLRKRYSKSRERFRPSNFF